MGTGLSKVREVALNGGPDQFTYKDYFTKVGKVVGLFVCFVFIMKQLYLG